MYKVKQLPTLKFPTTQRWRHTEVPCPKDTMSKLIELIFTLFLTDWSSSRVNILQWLNARQMF